MGRTLHYSVTNAVDITENEKDIIFDVSLDLNSGEYENVWTSLVSGIANVVSL